MTLPHVMILALAITTLIEILFAFIIKIRDKQDILNIVLANILTNPLLVSVTFVIFLKYGERVQSMIEILVEIIVLVIEGLIYEKYLRYNKINPFLISFILNFSSYIMGSWAIDKLQQIILFNQI